MMKSISLCLALAFIVSLLSCSRPAGEGIVGTWQAGNQVVEIKEDGSIVFTDKLKEQVSNGNYQFLDDKRVKVTFTDASSEELIVSVSRESLMVTRPDGTVFAKYTRVK